MHSHLLIVMTSTSVSGNSLSTRIVVCNGMAGQRSARRLYDIAMDRMDDFSSKVISSQVAYEVMNERSSEELTRAQAFMRLAI